MYYLLGSLFLLAIWLLIFLWQKNLRREMLIASLLITPAAFSEIFFVPGYWSPKTLFNPKLSLEDFIFSFAVGGIIAVIYEIFMRSRIRHKRLCDCFEGEVFHGAILGIGVVVIFAVYFLFRINFMYAVYVGLLIDIMLIILTRPDLVKKIIFSGLLFGFLYFFFFSIASSLLPDFIRQWNLTNLSGVIIFNVPLEEILWAIGAGALIGPIYEYLLSIKLIERR